MLDCELLREVYINLLDAKEPKFNLSSNNLSQSVSAAKGYNKKIVNVSEDEIKRHKLFLKRDLKKNFYWIFLSLYSFSKLTNLLIFMSLNPEFSNKKTNICLNSE